MTSYRTSLFFAQAIGRGPGPPTQGDGDRLPAAVRPLLELAAEIEVERNHIFRIPPTAADDALDELVELRPDASDNLETWRPLGAEAEFAHVLHSGKAVAADYAELAPDDESQDFLGLPGLLTAEQTAALLAKRDGEIRKKARASRSGQAPDVDLTPWEELAQLRREVNAAVAAVSSASGNLMPRSTCGFGARFPAHLPTRQTPRSCANVSSRCVHDW